MRRVSIVPHTHWDREWYAPFQTFRMRLVELLDGLIPQLETDPDYRHFILDGQMAVIDDYLAVRPEASTAAPARPRGRVAMGPWYILMDEFLVSGETIVRDMQLGLDVRGGVRRRDGRRLSARHVRPHRADAPAARAVRLRARGGVAGRAVGRRPQRVLVGGARRLEVRAEYLASGLQQWRGSARVAQGAARTDLPIRAEWDRFSPTFRSSG